MRPGRASRTAELMCMGRALAHGTIPVERFVDPTAMALLPDDARQRVDRIRNGLAPEGFGARIEGMYLRRQSRAMVARTVAVDDAIRGTRSPQVVILGAGLDGRAWRMPEFRDAVVFEVDHPDSQRDKRTRVAALTQTARDVRFAPVDFERDSLGEVLAKAGHDPSLATTWIWEGVVMYLTLADVEASLSVMKERSAKGSRLVVAYHSPGMILVVMGMVFRYLGEPLRSEFTAEAMSALLAKYGFIVVRDEDLHTIGASLSEEVGRMTKSFRVMRIVTADYQP